MDITITVKTVGVTIGQIY